MVEGRGGVFKVWKDGELIWDKHTEGRFPEPSEILAMMERKPS
jgi:predicted Rdx family selenoprotein